MGNQTESEKNLRKTPKENSRGLMSVILSLLSYDLIFSCFSFFIVFVGLIAAATYYKLTQKLFTSESFAKFFNETPEISVLLTNYQNIILMFIAVGILCYLISHSVKRHMDGEQVALLWQIEKIKEGSFEQRRSLRKTDRMHAVMRSLHDLAEHLNQSKSQNP